MIDYTKPVQTVSGEPVEIITTKGRGKYPIVGYIASSWDLRTWTKYGTGVIGNLGATDLINVPEKPKTIVRYVILYDDESMQIAKNSSDRGINCIACKRVEITEGVFDGDE